MRKVLASKSRKKIQSFEDEESKGLKRYHDSMKVGE